MCYYVIINDKCGGADEVVDAYIDERLIIAVFIRIAFDGEKDSERMRALEWLAEWLDRRKTEDVVLRKLDEVLAELRK